MNLTAKRAGGGGGKVNLGFLNAATDLGAVTIGGDLSRIGPIVVKGDITGTAQQAYLIRGTGSLTGTKSVAITSLKVGADFDHALVLAGYGASNAPANGHAQIGALRIGGDWIASSVTAGLLPFVGAPDATGIFGNGDDTFINAGPTGVVASIASITIKGRAVGTLETGDRFGIVESIGSTPDFFVREVARI